MEHRAKANYTNYLMTSMSEEPVLSAACFDHAFAVPKNTLKLKQLCRSNTRIHKTILEYRTR